MTNTAWKNRLENKVISLAQDALGSSDSTLLNSGEISSLRRMDPDNPSPAFWKLLAQVNAIEGDDSGLTRKQEVDLAFTIRCMAIMAPYHADSCSPGEALRRADFSELRLTRTFRSSDRTFHNYLLKAVRFMKSKNHGWNWYQFYSLASSTVDSKPRRDFARSYYYSWSNLGDNT